MQVRYALSPTPLGIMLVASNDEGICWIAFGDAMDQLEREFAAAYPDAERVQDEEALRDAIASLRRMIDEPRYVADMPLVFEGTPFQRRVWETLRMLPTGTTITYRELAERVGAPGSSRAVAGACAANRLALVIPCHRVVRSDGGLSGYRWGVERKAALLERERALRA